MTSPVLLPHDWFPRSLPRNVQIGERSWCYSSYAFAHYRSERKCGVSIGHDSGVYDPSFFDVGPDGQVEIGNFCTIVSVTMSTNSRIEIGDYSFVAHDVVIADSFAAIPPDQREAHTGSRRGPTISIAENCWIGARAVILGGARLGENSVVGAGAVVNFEVPPNSIVAGNPARVVGKVG